MRPEDSRWKDGSGVVHQMMWLSGVPGRWITVCGTHEHVVFKHPKRCPKPVTCAICLGLS